MTRLLFQTDSYLKEFEAAVVSIDAAKRCVVLDRTAFYPGGGGQPCDLGLLAWNNIELSVMKTAKSGDSVEHQLGEGPLPDSGVRVSGSLDWNRRYRLMRTHTAMHILCGVIFRDWGAQVTGGNMEPLAGRMDFEFESMNAELVGEIEKRVNAEVSAARDVRVAILPRSGAEKIPDLIRTKVNLLPPGLTEIRTVEIVGLDLQADGGTHVTNTREVGRIVVAGYESKGRINKRIKIQLEE